MLKKNLFFFIGSILFLTSCGGWSDKNKAEYLKICKKKELSSNFCECALEKSTTNYSDFDSAMKDELGTSKIFLDCIDKDRTKEEVSTSN
jgi:hypothetical protein